MLMSCSCYAAKWTKNCMYDIEHNCINQLYHCNLFRFWRISSYIHSVWMKSKKSFKYIGHPIQILLDISIDKYKYSSFIVNCFNFQNTCTISFPANHKTNGKYAVAVSVEDFPKSTIHIGSHVYTPNNKLSTVNLQVIYS